MTPNPLIPWLPELNPAWPVRRARFLLRPENRPVRDDDGVVTSFRDGQVTLRENRRVDGFTIAVLEQGYQGVEPGDLVIHSMDAFAGAIGVCDSRGKCTPEYVIVNGVEGEADNRYYAYVLRLMAHRDFIRVICQSVRERAPRFRFVRLQEVNVPAPSIGVQRRVADYLDRKTADIDALIEKKSQFFSLLECCRASTLQEALGGSHTSQPTQRLKHFCQFVTSGPRGWGQYYSEGGAAFLRIGNVARSSIDLLLDDIQRVTPPSNAEGFRTLAEPGDVLVTITADIGSVGVVPAGIGEAYVNQHIALVRPSSSRVNPRFLAYCAKSTWGAKHFTEAMQGGTKVGLTLDDVRNMPLPVLPPQVQDRVASFLDSRYQEIGSCQKALSAEIARLNTYRQSLITAAVTGQFDLSSDPPLPAGVQP